MLPRNLRPMRLSRRSEPFDSEQFIYELKIDGFRALAHIADGQGELVSRKGNVFRGFAELATWLAEHLRVESAVLDGGVSSPSLLAWTLIERTRAETGKEHLGLFAEILHGLFPHDFFPKRCNDPADNLRRRVGEFQQRHDLTVHDGIGFVTLPERNSSAYLSRKSALCVNVSCRLVP